MRDLPVPPLMQGTDSKVPEANPQSDSLMQLTTFKFDRDAIVQCLP